MLSAFPCGRTQHVRRMRSSIVSIIQSVLEFRLMPAIPNSRLNLERAMPVIFQVITVLPFSSKNAFKTAYLLESSLTRFKNFVFYFELSKL